ncbi:tryptophan synthase subunit alpha [Lactiplantibacillus songbeiensis]|uniref:Tryptophan synthase alpha chain n=1 Tax=Lactiplantibacillus songbeiensis TaxID=2559920 RepID=A0ABW4BYR1_9LACO|nr:tryptophan synthase subunit alpha [Lactiplantibacillus songbeiensis]
MTNLKAVFDQQKVFMPFIVADDPDVETTVKSIVTLAENGADVVELGLPFSDPVADGPVIQAADLRAFKAGVKTATVFEIVEQVRTQTAVPIVLLTYVNLVYKYGYDAFCQRCQQLDISGLVIPDLPLEENAELKAIATKHHVALVPLIAPTSGKRITKIAAQATGFIYVVSAMGVTGQREQFSKQLATTIAQIRAVTTVPVAIGFGIHSPQQAHELGQLADGIIIGSAIVKLMAAQPVDLQAQLANYAQSIKQALS